MQWRRSYAVALASLLLRACEQTHKFAKVNDTRKMMFTPIQTQKSLIYSLLRKKPPSDCSWRYLSNDPTTFWPTLSW
jgi:hypothetical protein